MKKVYLITGLLTGLAFSNMAQAYMGPGAGLSAIGSVVALIGGLALMLVGFLWYPFKRILKRRKSDSTTD